MPLYNPDKWIEQLMTCQHLPEADMKLLCDRVREILMEESNIHPISSPVTICGDIHGQFWDLLELMRKGGKAPETSYIFMARRLLTVSHRDTRARFSRREISWTGDITVWRLFPCFWPLKQGMKCPTSRIVSQVSQIS
jgi:hypothetical protein